MKNATVVGAKVIAVISAVRAVYSINCEYEACMTKIRSLQSELNILRKNIEANHKTLQNLDSKMGRLNVVSTNNN